MKGFKPMKPTESRLAAILLVLLALVLGYFVLLHWWFVAPLRGIADQMDELRDVQSRYAAAIADKPALQKRLATLGEGQASDAAFLPEDDVNTAAASLMDKVVNVVQAHPQGGNCEVTQKMAVPDPPASDSEPYRRAAVNIGMRCDVQPLAAVLHDLEQGTPYLFIDDLSIYRNPVAAPNGAVAPLEVQFTVTGYVRQARAASSAAHAGGGA